MPAELLSQHHLWTSSAIWVELDAGYGKYGHSPLSAHSNRNLLIHPNLLEFEETFGHFGLKNRCGLLFSLRMCWVMIVKIFAEEIRRSKSAKPTLKNIVFAGKMNELFNGWYEIREHIILEIISC